MGSEEISSLTGSGAEVEEDVKNEDASRARVGTTDSDLCSKVGHILLSIYSIFPTSPSPPPSPSSFTYLLRPIISLALGVGVVIGSPPFFLRLSRDPSVLTFFLGSIKPGFRVVLMLFQVGVKSFIFWVVSISETCVLSLIAIRRRWREGRNLIKRHGA